MNERGGSCFPSRETLARETGQGLRSVARHIRTLEEAGWLTIESGGGKATNRYRATVPGAQTDPCHSGTGAPVAQEDVRPAGSSLSSTKADLGAKAATTRARPRNVLFDALAEETQADPTAEGGRIAAAQKVITGLWEAKQGTRPPAQDAARADWDYVLVVEIRHRAHLYRRRWPNVELTPSALAKNWERVTTPRPGGGLTPEQIREEGRKAQEAGL
jgi:hypothetical protein